MILASLIQKDSPIDIKSLNFVKKWT